MAESLFQIKMRGNDISPKNIKAKDIADILASFEDAISSVAVRQNEGLNKEEIVLSLVGIHPGSLILEFAPQLPEILYPAYQTVTNAINTSNYQGIPDTAINGLRKITSFTRTHRCEIEFNSVNGKTETLATIIPTTIIQVQPLISGQTTIYGYVSRVGGNPPKAYINITDGKSVSCTTSVSIVKQLAQRLYSWVGLEGTAKWNSTTFDVEEFEIQSILDYSEGPILQTLEELSPIISPYYQDIDDVDLFVSNSRGDDMED